jgi:hypothetical protein
MKIIHVVSGYSQELNKNINALSIDGEVFDWGLEMESWNEAKKIISQHSELTETVTTSILNHFCQCFSEFVGKNMNLQEINEAIEKGYIEC